MAEATQKDAEKRQEGCEHDHDEVELYNHCYIVNSLKHPDEVNVLRKIYGKK